MEKRRYNALGYALALTVGALAGSLLVLLGTKAVPRMVARATSAMMQSMKTQMVKVGINPVET